MTEDEAREKWCPFGRTGVLQHGRTAVINRPFGTEHEFDPLLRCIGSDCMAWRWHVTTLPMGIAKYIASDEKVGYCGLAGEL